MKSAVHRAFFSKRQRPTALLRIQLPFQRQCPESFALSVMRRRLRYVEVSSRASDPISYAFACSTVCRRRVSTWPHPGRDRIDHRERPQRPLDLLFDRISRLVQPHGTQSGNHSPGFPDRRFSVFLPHSRIRSYLQPTLKWSDNEINFTF